MDGAHASIGGSISACHESVGHCDVDEGVFVSVCACACGSVYVQNRWQREFVLMQTAENSTITCLYTHSHAQHTQHNTYQVLGLLEVAPSETFLQQAVAAYTACLARELGVTSAANDQDSGASGAASEMLENAADKQDSGAAGVKVDGAADKQDSSELQRDNATDMRVSAANVLARDEEACLNLASGLAAAGAPAHIFQVCFALISFRCAHATLCEILALPGIWAGGCWCSHFSGAFCSQCVCI